MKLPLKKPNLNRRVSGVTTKINMLRREFEIPAIPYLELKAKVSKALRARKLICPICLSSTTCLYYVKQTKGFFKFWSESACKSCLKLAVSGIEIPTLKTPQTKVD